MSVVPKSTSETFVMRDCIVSRIVDANSID